MPKDKKEIQKEDIMPLDVYIKNRKELRKNILDFKKNRRVALGPYATFYFESYEKHSRFSKQGWKTYCKTN